MIKYDLVVIGGGPAGYAAAMRGIDFGKKVCLIERNKIGGAGLYNGALSSKTLWELAEKVININDTIVSDGNEPYKITWNQVKKTLDDALFERKFQYSCQITQLQQETDQTHFVLEKGCASFISANEIQIKDEEGEKVIFAENIIIATGSRPRLISNIAVDESNIFTSDGIEKIKDFPKSIVIVGAGVIGCEYATIFANFGQTKVYIIDRQDRILPFEDEDVSELISNKMEDKGITIHHNAQLDRMEIINGQVEYELSYQNGEKEIIHVEKALLSIGRVPNIEDLKLENAGVLLSKRGIHIGDTDTQTNVQHIYAVGDVSGRIALVNMGEIEGRHAVERIFGQFIEPISYDNVCTIMFLNPEVAAVGINEQECLKKNLSVKIVKIDYSVIARAIAMRKTDGFFKIIVTNDKEMKILGMRVVGEHASSAIQAIGLLIKMNVGIEVLSELIHPHPSIVEGIQECVRMLLKKAIFKSAVLNDKLECYSLVNGVKTHLERL
jgi:dihydrolipoamide dehydrogenase